jgi:endonuclease/exonuclease/phosphatase family metal-dependent hydrolase
MNPLTLLTWNILAPCYYKLGTVEYGRKVKVEAQLRTAWERRLGQQLAVMKELAPDVIALQEVWFKPDVFARIREALGSAYGMYPIRRPMGKDDGVALLVKRDTWSVEEARPVEFADAGNRVMMMAHLQAAGSASSTAAPSVIVGTTHFTYPHGSDDTRLRLAQAHAATAELLRFAREVEQRHSRSSVITQLSNAAMSRFGTPRAGMSGADSAVAGGAAAKRGLGASSSSTAVAGASGAEDGASSDGDDDCIEVEVPESLLPGFGLAPDSGIAGGAGSATAASATRPGPASSIPVILCGDCNHWDDEALRYLRAVGWRDSYASVRGPHGMGVDAAAAAACAAGLASTITHVTHSGHQVGVDHVLVYAPASTAAGVGGAGSEAAAERRSADTGGSGSSGSGGGSKLARSKGREKAHGAAAVPVPPPFILLHPHLSADDVAILPRGTASDAVMPRPLPQKVPAPWVQKGGMAQGALAALTTSPRVVSPAQAAAVEAAAAGLVGAPHHHLAAAEAGTAATPSAASSTSALAASDSPDDAEPGIAGGNGMLVDEEEESMLPAPPPEAVPGRSIAGEGPVGGSGGAAIDAARVAALLSAHDRIPATASCASDRGMQSGDDVAGTDSPDVVSAGVGGMGVSAATLTARAAADSAAVVAQQTVSCFHPTRKLAELSFADFCNLSDHRPVWASFQVTAPEGWR